jgi:hypothetical protein
MQKRASAGAGVPQCGHERWSAVPQPMQNRASGGLAVSHLPQISKPATGHPSPNGLAKAPRS